MTLMTKKCTVCKESKPLDSFALNKIKKDGHTNICKSCKSNYNKGYYTKTKHIHNPARYATRQKVKQELQSKLIAMKESNPCTDCNRYYRFWQMDFDHLDDKEFNISTYAGRSEKMVMAEIAKCELVCANCHRTRTYIRLSGRLERQHSLKVR